MSRWALRCLGLNQLFERAHRDIVLPELIPHKGVVEGHVRLVREVPRGVVEEICSLTQRYGSARSAPPCERAQRSRLSDTHLGLVACLEVHIDLVEPLYRVRRVLAPEAR